MEWPKVSERPKSAAEIANEILRKLNPREMMKEQSKKSPSLDDDITNEIDVSQNRAGHNDGK
jgi:hypothetical protein